MPNENSDQNTHVNLINLCDKDYEKSAYRQHLFDQYKLFVESSIRVTEWRNAANKYFLGINTVLISASGVTATFMPSGNWAWVVAAAGACVSLVWWLLIRSYKELNSSKFQVIHELETHLPARIFEHEWALIEERRKYRKLAILERWVPVVFGVLHFVVFFVAVLDLGTRPLD